VEWIYLDQDMNQWRRIVNTTINKAGRTLLLRIYCKQRVAKQCSNMNFFLSAPIPCVTQTIRLPGSSFHRNRLRPQSILD